MPGRNALIALVVLVLLVLSTVVAFAWLVWPTPWRYHTVRGNTLREHRWSGQIERLWLGEGWRPVHTLRPGERTIEGGWILESEGKKTTVEELDRLFQTEEEKKKSQVEEFNRLFQLDDASKRTAPQPGR